MSKLISLLLSIAIFVNALLLNAPSAMAQFSPPNNLAVTAAREYFVGRDLGKPLITVHLLNGVGSPGVYHVPSDTDLAELISYAGGATERTDLSSVTVRRNERGRFQITELDLEKALKEPIDLFHVQDQDVVQFKQHYNPERTLQWVGIVSAIASIVMTIYLVKDFQKN